MDHRERSFDFTRTFEDCTYLGDGHMTAALCAGSPPILFDPGISVFGPRCWRELQARANDTTHLIIALTHAHFDHCGAAAYLLGKMPAARLAASARAADILQRPNAVELIRQLNEEYEQDMPAEAAGEDVSFETLTVTDSLRDGDALRLENGRLCRVLETPGHTRDSLSYYFPDTGIAFIGEAAGAVEQGFIHSLFLVSYEDYIASLEKIRDLKPRAICLPHNGMLAGEHQVQGYLAEAVGAAVAYKDMIQEYLKLYSGDQERVVERITREEYDTRPDHIQRRQPFILNLRAKVNAVAAWCGGQERA